MNIKEKTVVFPYSAQFAPILRHREFLNDYEVINVVSPRGWQLSGNDACIVDGSESMGIIVSDDFEEALNLGDTVLFIEWPEIYDIYDLVKNKIRQAITSGKNIVCAFEIDHVFKKEIIRMCDEKGISFKYFGSGRTFYDSNNINIERETVYELNTPVVFVLGVSENTNKFELQLALRESFIKKGYKICQIGTRSYCDLLGFHSFPEFMYNCSIHESKKIVLFNHYVKKLEIVEKPDIIIIGIPGAIMPFNKKFTNKFGILAYEISSAVTPDIAILSVLFAEYSQEFFKRLFDTIKYKFGYEIDCFNIANTIFEQRDSDQENTMVFTTLSSQYITRAKKRFKLPGGIALFNVLNPGEAQNLHEYIVDKLANNECSEII